MVPDVRSSGGNNVREFDLNSPAGVVAVLAAIRASGIAVAERNELRDLVLVFTRDRDERVQESLLAELMRQQIVPLVATIVTEGVTSITIPPPEIKIPNEVPIHTDFVQARPIPRFTQPTIAVAPAVMVIPAPVPAPVPAPTTVPVYILPEIPVIAEIVSPIPIIPAPTAPTAPIPPPEPEPITPPAPVADEVVSVSKPEPIAVMPDLVTAAATRQARIQEIKSVINAEVGNPVNLVDIDNTLGRDYMSALLAAMKLAPGVVAIEAEPVMERLEKVFTAVTARVAQLSVGEKKLTVAPEIIFEAKLAEVPTQTYSVPVAAVIVPIPQRKITPRVVADLPRPPAEIAESGYQSTPTTDTTPPSTILTPTVESPIIESPSEDVSQFVSPTILQSVAATAPALKTLADLPTADSLITSSLVGDVLFTDEVDNGLNQLLSEWALFKKSGLFGTGPQGRKHPLFIKIAELSIPLILSGRFEGATQEVKQSITDYMNGWRYEQGIIYEQNEFFEHYLRRVIRHIIDLQNKRRGS